MADAHANPMNPMGGNMPPQPPLGGPGPMGPGGMGPGGMGPGGPGAAGPGAGMDPNQNLQVNVPDSVKAGAYSNAVSVNVNSNEVVVDFGYLLPNTPLPIIEVVSRVNMNHKTAQSFLEVLSGAMEDFKQKQAAADAAQAAAQNPAGGMAPPAPAGPAPMDMPPMGPPPAPGAPSAPLPSNS